MAAAPALNIRAGACHVFARSITNEKTTQGIIIAQAYLTIVATATRTNSPAHATRDSRSTAMHQSAAAPMATEMWKLSCIADGR